MKKLLTLTAVGAILSAPAFAVQKCVTYDSSTTTCATDQPVLYYLGKSEWTGTCTTNGVAVPIVGVGKCSSTSGAISSPKYQTSLAISQNHLNNKYCYCRVISPFVSNWVYAFAPAVSDTNTCEYSCANQCANALNEATSSYPSWFKAFLFQGLSD